MKTKIRVHGKSQSRTALGIVNAYLKLYPNSTLSDLQKAFPKSLNPKSFTDNIIVPEKETKGNEKLFFEQEDELIVLKNGERLSLVELWRKEDFDAICEHAKQYGIEADVVETLKPFERGSYELEYLDGTIGTIPPAGTAPASEESNGKRRKFGWWWILLLILLLLILLLLCWKKCCNDNKCSQPNGTPIENTTPADSNRVEAAPDSLTPDSLLNPVASSPVASNLVRDMGDFLSVTLPDGKELKIDKNSPEFKLFTFLNSEDAKVDTLDKAKGWITLDKLNFEKGSTRLTPESEGQLKNIARIMQFFPNSSIKLGGYTDNTGTDAINMRVSTQRAKVSAEKLISLGVKANRVAYEGYGSQFPVCPANDTDACRAANRRIDIRVTQK